MHLSVFDPSSPEAAHLLWLWNACIYVCAFILAVVTISMLYTLVRYRQRDDREPLAAAVVAPSDAQVARGAIMPAFASSLKPDELAAIVAFLDRRKPNTAANNKE